MALSCSETDSPSGPPWSAPASCSSLRLATRISKNSSRFAHEMHRNLTRSSSGMRAVLRLLQYALVEFQERELAVDVRAAASARSVSFIRASRPKRAARPGIARPPPPPGGAAGSSRSPPPPRRPDAARPAPKAIPMCRRGISPSHRPASGSAPGSCTVCGFLCTPFTRYS